MDSRIDRRGFEETFFRGKHLKLTELKEELSRIKKSNQYLSKLNDSSRFVVPAYPLPEFHVSHLTHDTNALFEEFRTPSAWGNARKLDPKDSPHADDLLWWSLSVRPEDMQLAEKRLLDRTFPDRTDEQAARQEPFLQQFATSPSFLNTSRFGSFRLTFPLQELLGEYRKQVCDGSEPVLRVYETVMYKQKVLYSVLVHSNKYNNAFKELYPLLDDSQDAVCAYQDGHIIWRPEAMCETHRFTLVPTPEKKFVAYETSMEYFVWDNVSVAFHLPEAQMLTFDGNRMRRNLKFCDSGFPTVPKDFHYFEDATKMVEQRWPGQGPLSRAQE